MVTLTNSTAEDFYILAINVPFLDNFLSQIHDRFLKHCNNLLQRFSFRYQIYLGTYSTWL